MMDIIKDTQVVFITCTRKHLYPTYPGQKYKLPCPYCMDDDIKFLKNQVAVLVDAIRGKR